MVHLNVVNVIKSTNVANHSKWFRIGCKMRLYQRQSTSRHNSIEVKNYSLGEIR